MSAFFSDADAWLLAVLLAGAMLAGWAIGWWRGWSLHKEERETSAGKFNDAILALLGLLLAFTFSMSLAKHEQRRQMMVIDTNAIGDFYTCASLLKEPFRGKLQAEIRRYVEHRLSLAQSSGDKAVFQQKLNEIPELHRQMQSLVEEAVIEGTPVVAPLVNTLNAMTSSHVARVVAARDQLPPSIVLLLILAAVLSMALTGRQQGESRQLRLGSTIGFTVLVCMVVWITLDLNQPQRGLITISQEPLLQLLTSMSK